jgi:hypothetical protein
LRIPPYAPNFSSLAADELESMSSVDESKTDCPAAPERRKHPRYACEGHAEVFLPHGALLFRGRILDLSVSGCMIEAAGITLERGTHVEIYFTTRRLQFRVPGNIAVLYRGKGVGIAFYHVSRRMAGQIREVVSELAESQSSEQCP